MAIQMVQNVAVQQNVQVMLPGNFADIGRAAQVLLLPGRSDAYMDALAASVHALNEKLLNADPEFVDMLAQSRMYDDIWIDHKWVFQF